MQISIPPISKDREKSITPKRIQANRHVERAQRRERRRGQEESRYSWWKAFWDRRQKAWDTWWKAFWDRRQKAWDAWWKAFWDRRRAERRAKRAQRQKEKRAKREHQRKY